MNIANTLKQFFASHILEQIRFCACSHSTINVLVAVKCGEDNDSGIWVGGADWTVITRTIVPMIQLPAPAPGVDGATGLGDLQESLFLSPAKVGPVIWGAGPVISFPTATELLPPGTGKLSVGPTACCAYKPRALVIRSISTKSISPWRGHQGDRM